MASVTTTVLSTSQKTKGQSGIDDITTTESESWKLKLTTEDFLYPLYEECSTHSKIPSVIVILHFIVQFIQLSVVSSMLLSKKINSDTFHPAFYILLKFADFGMTYQTFDGCFTQFLVLVIIYALMLLFIIFMVIYHKAKKTFLKFQVAIWQTFSMIIVNVLICPTAVYSGKAFVALTTDASLKNIVLFIVSILMFLSFFSVFIFSSYMFTLTPYLVDCISYGWDPRPNLILSFILFLGAITGTAVEVFADWLMYLFVIFIFLLFMVVYRYYLYFPHFYYGYTVISSSLILFYMYNCIISILKLINFFPITYNEVVAAIGAGIIIISLIINIITFKIRKDKNLKILNNEEPRNDKEKYIYFDTLTFKNIDHAKMLLRLGIKYHCKLFIDFSFIRYLIDYYSHPQILIDILQILSLFPGQQQMLSLCLSLVSNLPKLNIFQGYLIYQVHRIHILRQSTISIEGNKQLTSLEKHSNKVIATIRGFWNEVSKSKAVTMASFKSLADLSNETNSVFLDTIEKYPNSQKIYESYCKFLIEGMGDYNSAIKIAKICTDMELGKRKSVDHSYHLFVNLFPDYIKLGILNQKGYFTNTETELKSEQSLNAVDSYETFQDGLNKKYDELSTTLFNHSKLRLTIQNSLDNYKFHSLTNSRIIGISQFILLIALALIIIYLCSYCTSPLLQYFRINPIITNISTSLQYISVVGSVDILMVQGLYDKQQMINDIFPSTEEQQNLENFSTSYFDTTVLTGNDIYKEIKEKTDEELRTIYSNAEAYSQQINVLGNISNSYVHVTEFNTFSGFPSSLRSYIHYATSVLNDLLSRFSLIYINPTGMLKYIQPFIVNTPRFSNRFIELSEVLKQQIDEEGSYMSQLIIILPLVLGFIVLIAFILLGLPFFTSIKKDTSKILKILENVKDEDIQESFNPIYLKTKGKLTLNFSHSSQKKDTIDIGLIVITSVAIILLVFLFVFLIISTRNIIRYLQDISSMAELCSVRIITLLSTLLRSIIDRTSYRILFQSDPLDYSSILNELNDYNLEILQRIVGLNDDSSYYLNDECDIHQNLTYSKYLQCVSMNTKMNILMKKFKEFLTGTTFRTSSFSTILYLIDLYLFDDLRNFQNTIYQITYSYSMRELYGVYGLVGGLAIVTIILLIYELTYIHVYSVSFNFFKQLMLFLPPLSIVNNKTFMDFILENTNETKVMTPSESILNSTSFAIITVDSNLIIQNVNSSFQHLTGLLPDQILGRSLNWFIPTPNSFETDSKQRIFSARFYSCINEIQAENREADQTLQLYCMKENGSTIFVKVSLIPLLDENTNKLSSITLLIESLETETTQKQMIHDVKEKCKQLMNALLPKEMIENINFSNQQEKSLTYKSDSSIVIFVELVGAENNVFSMLPKNLISSLTKIYDAFEEIEKSFQFIRTIKANGTNIIACTDLFENNKSDDDLYDKAKEVIMFCEELIEHFESPNSTFNLSIQPRIGIAKGELMCNIELNQEIPLYRIVGNAIDLAEDVVLDAPLGTVVVTKDIKDLLSEKEFKISESYRKDLFNVESIRLKK